MTTAPPPRTGVAEREEGAAHAPEDFEFTVSGSYHVRVNAPGAAPAPPREWLVRAFDIDASSGGPLLASCAHENLECATDDVFRAIRADIDERLRRLGLPAGISSVAHDGAGADEHRARTNADGLTSEQVAEWCARVDELLAKRPYVNAHQLRNMAGEFAFSPGTFRLCRVLGDCTAHIGGAGRGIARVENIGLVNPFAIRVLMEGLGVALSNPPEKRMLRVDERPQWTRGGVRRDDDAGGDRG